MDLTNVVSAGAWLTLGIGIGWVARTQRWRRSAPHGGSRVPGESRASVGAYSLLETIGEGGMGVVYRAHHARLRRPTAVKVMRFRDTDPKLRREALARFEREAALTSQLSHPNTVAIYDFGATEHGDLYYAMELIDGIDLQRLVELGGPLPAGRVIHLMLQACGSLAEAHAHGLIHRDIKPGNLLLCDRGGVIDTLKVVDFGLVKDLGAQSISTTSATVGTPAYVAPELILHPDQPTRVADVYALGAVMYWLLTSQPVSGPAQGTEAIARALSAPPNPPSSLVADVPIDLERVVMRCLDRNPFERPQSADELAEDLRQCTAFGAWTRHDGRREWERTRHWIHKAKQAPST